MALLQLLPSSRGIPPALQSDVAKSSKCIPVQFAKFQLKEFCKQTPSSGHLSALCKQSQLQEAVNYVTELESQKLTCEPDIISELLQSCVQEQDVFLGQQLHAIIIKHGELFSKNEFIQTKLVIFYAKCDLLSASLRLFCRLGKRDVFSWAAIIGIYCRLGFCVEALWGSIEMLEDGILGDNFVIPSVLKACGALEYIEFGKCVHGYVLKLRLGDCVFVGSSLVDMYGKCGILNDAVKVFDGMIDRNVVVWNSMIVSYVQNGFNEEAIQLFHEMRMKGIKPTPITVSSFLSASANICAVDDGKQGHALAILNGFELDNILGSSIVHLYAKVELFKEANLVFDQMIGRDVVTWNSLITSYVDNGMPETALSLCHEMKREGIRFNSVTLSSIISISADTREIGLGKEGHCYSIRHNFEEDIVVRSAVINMYSKCERLQDAKFVFDMTKEKDLVLWNTMLAAYAELGFSCEALRLFHQMHLDDVPLDIVSWNSVMHAFLRNGQVDVATEMFSQTVTLQIQPNLITYTTLISGLSRHGLGSEAMTMFQEMLQAGIQPNTITISSVLSASAHVASLQSGRAIHGYIMRHELPYSVSVVSSLVDMYAKCGCLNQAKHVFDMFPMKELPVYNAMISAYGSHGFAKEAFGLYKQLVDEGLKPDSITFTSVLLSCSHAGLVREGLDVFRDMISLYGVKPSIEHYSCMLTLLSRKGNVHGVLKLMQTMPIKPDARLLGSLLAACKELKETEVGEQIAESLLRIEPDNAGNYIAVSNAHAALGRWSQASNTRNLMKEKGLKKSPGCSWIEIGLELHVFLAGDRSHLKSPEIYATLALLEMEMRSSC